MEERIHRFKLSEIQLLYEKDKQRLISIQQEYAAMKRRLERERVLESLDLKNCRAELEIELEQVGNEIALLTERTAQYDQFFI